MCGEHELMQNSFRLRATMTHDILKPLAVTETLDLLLPKAITKIDQLALRLLYRTASLLGLLAKIKV